MLSWMLIEYLRFGKATMLGAALRHCRGLGRDHSGGGFVNIPAAMVIGFVTSIVSYTAISYLKPRLGYDDALMCLACTGSQAFGVHSLLGSSRVPLSMRRELASPMAILHSWRYRP